MGRDKTEKSDRKKDKRRSRSRSIEKKSRKNEKSTEKDNKKKREASPPMTRSRLNSNANIEVDKSKYQTIGF